MKLSLLALLAALLLPSASAMSWSFLSEKQILAESDFIALVDIKRVSETPSTPEGLKLQSATADIEQFILPKPPVSDLQFRNRQVVIYSLQHEDVDGASLPIQTGKALVCLKRGGFGKFVPSNPWSISTLDENGCIRWPTAKENPKPTEMFEVIPATEAIARLIKLRDANP